MDKNLQRDELILAHIGLYRVTLRTVLSPLFFDRRPPGNVIQRLLAEGRIQSRAGLPDRLRYYQLTASEAMQRGLPIARTRPPKPQALQTHLGVLWYCCLRPTSPAHRRLERHEMHTLFGNSAPAGAHILLTGSSPRVYRVLVAGTGIKPRGLATRLRTLVASQHRHPSLGAWVRNRQYAFLVLAASEPWRVRFQEFMTSHAQHFHSAQVEVHFCPISGRWPHALRAAERGPGTA